MKGLRRILWNGLAALSALVCVGSVALLIRSYSTSDQWRLSYKSDGADTFASARGTVSLDHINPEPGKTRGGFGGIAHDSLPSNLRPRPQPYPHRQAWRGFIFENVQQADVDHYYVLKQAPDRLRGQYADVMKSNSGLPERVRRAIVQNRIEEAVAKWANVRYTTGTRDASTRWRFTMPLWPIVALAAVAPAVWLVDPLRKRRRRKAGQCAACGYDLTGNVSGVCPECGAEVRT